MHTRTPDEAIDALRADGHRMTAARMAIVDIVLTAGTPLSAQDVSVALAKRSVSANVTTVYRELEFLRERGLCVPVTFADGVQRYEPSDLGHHHHLVCVGCNAIQDIELPQEELHAAEKRIEKSHGFTVLQHALEFYGRCGKLRD